MTIDYKTDLDTAKDLERLCSIVNESIEKANTILKKAQEIDEVKALIREIDNARTSLNLSKASIQEIEKSASDKLKQAEIIANELKDLKRIPKQLDELGISSNILQELQSSLLEVQESKIKVEEIHKSSRKIMTELDNQATQNARKFSENMQILTGQSEKFNRDIQHIQQLMLEHDRKIADAQIVLNQLTSVLAAIGGMDGIENFERELRNARVQLQESRQEVTAVRSLESYLQDFQKHRNHKKLKQWLWKELGIVGMLIYFLSLITSRNK